MLAKQITRMVLYGIGLGSLAAIIYFVGPFIAIGNWRPLENTTTRAVVILLLVAAAAGVAGLGLFRRRAAAKKIAEGISGEKETVNDEPVLKERMQDALATLKTASGNKSGYLYDIPWYVIIGPPGAGKTTALVNSGLKFPLARGARPAAIAGVGGTRYCDWWFTEEAVLIDTAGRYTTQDSDAKADKESWFSFLDLLKKSRSRQPINGVLVAISIEDILTMSREELAAHAEAIRLRLLELHQRLKVSFPVYALFTKTDLVAGFNEYFSYLSEAGRRQVWGATFQTNDKNKNLVGEIPNEFDHLLERLSEETLDRLQDEPAPEHRVQLFGFPAQMARLKPQLYNFLNQIFEPTRYHVNASLRGFYFTSGTQQGTPIDQLIGSLARTFGAQEVGASAYSGAGKSFFLTDLISKVIIGEADWVSTDRGAVRRALIIKTAALSLIGLLSFGLIVAWITSFAKNSDMIAQTLQIDSEYSAAGAPLIKQTLIADRELDKVLPLLHRLRNAPAGYASRQLAVPLSSRYGLSQHQRMLSASDAAYHTALERLFRPRLLYRLEEQLNARLSEPAFVYETLKVYLMLGGLHPPEKEIIKSWMQRDWADNLYPGSTNAEGRRLLEEHLAAMFDLDTEQPPLVELDGRLIAEAQSSLARLSIAQRAYEFLKSEARASTAGDWIVTRKGGPDVPVIFETASGQPLDTVRVPAFFTYNGFHQMFITQLGGLSERMKRDRWVLGDAGQQEAVGQQYNELAGDLINIYSNDFVASWRAALGSLKLKKLMSDKPKYDILRALSAPTSPLRQILESIRDETMLTKERPKPAAAPGALPAAATVLATPSPTLFNNQDGPPGVKIEAQFKPFHSVLEGDSTRRPIDSIIATLNDIAQNLTLMIENPQMTAQATASLQTQVAALRNNAGRMPPPFSDMLRGAAAEFEGSIAASTAGQLLQTMRDQVTPVCQQTITNRYPFARAGTQEVQIGDFAKLFSPNGIIDRFFTQYLAPYADTSRPDWTWRKDSPVGRSLSADTLKQFQAAAYIRDAFFQTGGSMPTVSFAIKPPTPPSSGVEIKTEIGGTIIASPAAPAGSLFGSSSASSASQPPSTATSVQWPGPSTRTAISVSNEVGPPSVLERTGPWSLFRMLEAGSLTAKAETAKATFIVAGRELNYQITTGSVKNPLNLAALREFRCPSGI